ncbi:MAG: ABC transporter ATP-binding protein [Chloroflexi bacterium]|nr:ABC transporter ATP-binding protein [Chloroflexota bacterium]
MNPIEPTTETFAVEMKDITLRFPGVLANDRVNFTLRKGEIHALLGENGAGKSTLMNVLMGLYKPNAGSIFVDGKRVSFNSPRDAIAAGIGMVHQHFMLVPNQTVTENILIGLDEPKFVLNLKKYDQKVKDLANQFGIQIDPTSLIWQLSVGEQQRVEILKILYRGAQILIMDEPTAVLAPQEANELIDTLKGMARQGKSIIFISHKLNEVTAVADRLTILRKGQTTAEGITLGGITRESLASLMVGREIIFNLHKQEQAAGNVVLELNKVSALNNKNLLALRDVDLCLREGEILGIAGVAGNGQSELVEVITGLRECTGHILLEGKNIANKSPQASIAAGLAHIPEDRIGVGSAPNLSLTKNVIMKNYDHEPISSDWRINYTAADLRAKELKEQYKIQAPTIETQARKLSGGNLQKLILARELSSKPRLIVAMQPTRGLDVGAIEGVQELLLEERTQGSAILLVSEDLDELLSLSDRIAVMYEGEIVGTLNQKDADINTIGLMMTGSLRGDSSCSPEEQTTPAQASAEEPTSEQEAVTTFTEPRQFDRSKIVPMHRPFMESKREDKQTDDEGGE